MGTNTIIIGEIIEMITGNSLESEIRKRIIDKFGLKNTSYFISGTEIPGYHPKAYYGGDYNLAFPECSEWFDCSWAGAAGSIVSNLFELKIYAEALSGGYFLSDTLQQHRFDGHEGLDLIKSMDWVFLVMIIFTVIMAVIRDLLP